MTDILSDAEIDDLDIPLSGCLADIVIMLHTRFRGITRLIDPNAADWFERVMNHRSDGMALSTLDMVLADIAWIDLGNSRQITDTATLIRHLVAVRDIEGSD